MTVSYIILLIGACLIAWYTLWHSQVILKRKLFLLVIRLFLFLLFFCAFFQPLFTINRLASDTNTVSVLCDLSASMQLFYTDSVTSFFSRVSADRSKEEDRFHPRFSFFGFGDSLRPLQSLESVGFNDNNSLFPRVLREKALSHAKKILIISDGNWSNTVPAGNFIHEKECYYLPLRKQVSLSYCHIEVPQVLHSVVSDTPSTFSAVLSGFTAHSDTCILTCRMRNRTVAEKRMVLDSGFFTETRTIRIPARKAGSHLMELTGYLDDSLVHTCSILHTVAPARFSVYCYAARPSLDKRFVTHALMRKSRWLLLNTSELTDTKPDMCVLFTWDAKARELMKKAPRSSFCFIGCLPCADYVQHKASGGTPSIHPDFKHLFSTEALSDFPPLSVVIMCNQAPFTLQRVLVSYDSATAAQGTFEENVPLLYEAQFKESLILAFAARGLWRWDFWPQSIVRNRRAPFFTDFLIERMEELIQYNTNTQFYIYPSTSPFYETDSLSFSVALPTYLYNFSSIGITFTLCSLEGDTLSLTSLEDTPFRLHARPLCIPPCKKGRYAFFCTVRSDKGAISFNDTIRVIPDNKEFQVTGQNRVLLEELALPVPHTDVHQLESFFTDVYAKDQRTGEIITRTIHLKRSWIMLVIIFVLFSLEWVARRIWRLD